MADPDAPVTPSGGPDGTAAPGPDDREGDGDKPGEASRRRFLKVATGCLGGGLGVALLVPAGRLALGVAGRKTVTSASDPIDAIAAEQVGTTPVAVTLRAAEVHDAWSVTRDVPLGVAFVRKDEGGAIRALSAVCPHLGCTIGYDGASGKYACPCHDSFFAADGARLTGPSKRGLDELPVTVENGRVKIQWIRYRLGSSDKVPA
ncbi:MAG TPA: Rieske (2Fe-2S) protein [Kofleriaceae bacterium]|nr:Rieske (2Fe-2S) protein [Kofleriaceae bacterium]